MVWRNRLVVLGLLIAGRAEAQAQAQGQPAQAREVMALKVSQKQKAMRLKAIFREEPTAKEVQDWCLHLYRLEPSRINGWATNARLKALMPQSLQASVSNEAGSNYQAMKDGLYPGLPLGYDGSIGCSATNPNCGYKELTSTASTSLTWQVEATWGLDRLVFNSEELDARSTVSLEETLVREVTTMYFARRRLVANLMLSPPDSEEEAFYEQLRIEEMTANLNAFTDGEFGKHAYHGDFAATP